MWRIFIQYNNNYLVGGCGIGAHIISIIELDVLSTT